MSHNVKTHAGLGLFSLVLVKHVASHFLFKLRKYFYQVKPRFYTTRSEFSLIVVLTELQAYYSCYLARLTVCTFQC